LGEGIPHVLYPVNGDGSDTLILTKCSVPVPSHLDMWAKGKVGCRQIPIVHYGQIMYPTFCGRVWAINIWGGGLLAVVLEYIPKTGRCVQSKKETCLSGEVNSTGDRHIGNECVPNPGIMPHGVIRCNGPAPRLDEIGGY
jgi:hypothetical protein